MEIRVETPRPHIVLVTIANEPRRNAMNRAMLADLAALWDRLDPDPECRCIVLTGAGEKAFSAGADISGDLSAGAETARTINRALLKDTPFSKPIVAAVNGDCVGGVSNCCSQPTSAPLCRRRASACPKSAGRFTRLAARR